jgi:DNA repair exonuclease SbcCD nuclease subunit
MKVKVVSDLHLECCELGHGVPDLEEGEVLILGGDILCARHFKKNRNLHKVYKDFLKKCADNFEQVLYIAGNHEAYGYNYEGTWDVLKENLPKGIHLLENDYVKIQDWVFIGSTFWTDFRNENALEMMEAEQCLNDYKTIRITPKYRKMNANDTLSFHKKSKQYLLDRLEEFKNQKIWVLTHHAPSYQSVHEKYKRGGIANGAYVSDLDSLILDHPQIKYWSHGHTHESFDYMIGQCRVICNSRGYYNGYNNADLNLNFNPNLEIEI